MSLLRPTLSRTSLTPLRARTTLTQFHTTRPAFILPAGPQTIEGTINDPAPIPESNPKHGSIHWSFERLLSLGLIPLTIAPFAAGSLHPVMDAVLASATVMHSHIGFQSCVIDYIPKKKYPGGARAARWALNGATVLVLYGLYEFETNDVGVTEAVRKVWTA